MASIPCVLCGRKLEKRTDKNQKPYFVCDPCGIQMFVRRKQGIELLEKLMRAFQRKEITFQQHVNSVAEIQGILVEIAGVKKEIEKLDGQIGVFFPDKDKLAAQNALKSRLKGLLARLEADS